MPFSFIFSRAQIFVINCYLNTLICICLENELAKKSIFEICNQEKLISFESWLELKYVFYLYLYFIQLVF